MAIIKSRPHLFTKCHFEIVKSTLFAALGTIPVVCQIFSEESSGSMSPKCCTKNPSPYLLRTEILIGKGYGLYLELGLLFI